AASAGVAKAAAPTTAEPRRNFLRFKELVIFQISSQGFLKSGCKSTAARLFQASNHYRFDILTKANTKKQLSKSL
ncbi:MAG: hypothetical protein ACI9EH_001808, partial [Planktomarina sp.]